MKQVFNYTNGAGRRASLPRDKKRRRHPKRPGLPLLLQKRVGDAIHTILVNNRDLKYTRHTSFSSTKTTNKKKKNAATTAARDPDLQYVLELASDDELEELCDCLHETSVFSPIGKTVYMMNERRHGIRDEIASSRPGMEMYIESRFRFLAADVVSSLSAVSFSSEEEPDYWPTYRDILLDIKKKLDVPCPSTLATADLESEIFLHLLSQHAEYVGYEMNSESVTIARDCVVTQDDRKDDARLVRQSDSPIHQLKAAVKAALVSPISFGYKDVVPAVAKVATTLAITRVQLDVLRRVARVVVQHAIHHRALHTGSREFATRIAAETAKQRLLGAVAKYTALRQLFVCVGPLMWFSTAWDLAKLSLGTDYARLTRTVFMMAQIRLVRTRGWNTNSNE